MRGAAPVRSVTDDVGETRGSTWKLVDCLRFSLVGA